MSNDALCGTHRAMRRRAEWARKRDLRAIYYGDLVELLGRLVHPEKYVVTHEELRTAYTRAMEAL